MGHDWPAAREWYVRAETAFGTLVIVSLVGTLVAVAGGSLLVTGLWAGFGALNLLAAAAAWDEIRVGDEWARMAAELEEPDRRG